MDNQKFNEEKLREILQKGITNRVSEVGKDLMEFRSNFQQSAQVIIDNVSQIMNAVEEDVIQGLRGEISRLEAVLRTTLEPELRGTLEVELRALLEPEIRQKVESEIHERVNLALQNGAERAEEKARIKLEKLNGSLKEVSQQNTQVEILNGYLDKASLFTPRVALFVIKSGNLVGWQARGFEGEFTNVSIKSVNYPADRQNLLRQVSDSRKTFKGETAGNPDVTDVVSKFGPLAPDSICAIPLVVRDKTVAILYADSGLAPNGVIDIHSLEVITTVVSLTVEISSARTKLGLKPGDTRAPEAAREATHLSAPIHAATEPSAAAPIPIVQKAGVQEAPPAETAEKHEIVRESSVAPPAPAPLHTESTPKMEPPAPTMPHPPAPASKASITAPEAGEISEADQKLHNDARRFARLLVSEIKLYNEQKVQAGRRDKNLYALLHDDIDKSRQMYDKRVSPSVAARVDYFYDELVRILADNQVSALGKGCPGPAISH